jgi:thymidylate synthase
MYVIQARNVHAAIPLAAQHMRIHGVRCESRNGPVFVATTPVTTVYERPWERVIFYTERDANPFFHLYEALWMLAGRRDIGRLKLYAKQIAEYSDDGETLHDAYGYRWRNSFDVDQISAVIGRLRIDKWDRRSVVQMWDPRTDLDRSGKAVPCNLTLTLQVNYRGELDMVVFCRSNDVVWGCYGANAVHFSVLQEYIASKLGIPIGTYTQISVNWHAYLDTFKLIRDIEATRNPYESCPGSLGVVYLPMGADDEFLCCLRILLEHEEHEKLDAAPILHPWLDMCRIVLHAHHVWRKSGKTDTGELEALDILNKLPSNLDWAVAAREWMQRRRTRRLAKLK